MRLLFHLLFILVYFSSMANDNFDKGKDTYKNNNYPKAITLFNKAADQGSAKDQSYLGYMYGKGKEAK